MKASVILSTYNQPRALELVIWGYAVQSRRDFEIVIADDGSNADTAALVARLGHETDMSLVHVWHEDRGFRKTEILNRAILAATGDYLIFSDGDCIPRRDFVSVHVRHARANRYLSGGYLKLPPTVSEAVTVDDVRNGRVADRGWLRHLGWRPGRHALRLIQSPIVAATLDRLTPTRPTWNGHNASTWREAIVAVNGFDLDMAYGGEDRALGERLENSGFTGMQIRFRAPVLHLDHARPYVDAAAVAQNRAIRERIRARGEVRARQGLAELPR